MSSDGGPPSSASWPPPPALAATAPGRSPTATPQWLRRGASGNDADLVDNALRLPTAADAASGRTEAPRAGLADAEGYSVSAATPPSGSPPLEGLYPSAATGAAAASPHLAFGLPADDMPGPYDTDNNTDTGTNAIGLTWPPPPSRAPLSTDTPGDDLTGSTPLLSTYPAAPQYTTAGVASSSGHHLRTGSTNSMVSRLPPSSMPFHYRISPKLSELVRAAATREDEDAPFLNIPLELFMTSCSTAELPSMPNTVSACGTATASMLRTAAPPSAATTLADSTIPLGGPQRTDAGTAVTVSASPTSTAVSWASASFSSPRRAPAPSSTASTTAAVEALMVDPDAPRPRRAGLVPGVTSGGGGGGDGETAARASAFAPAPDTALVHDDAARTSPRQCTAVGSPVTQLSVADGPSTRALSPTGQGGNIASVVPAGTHLTAVPPSIPSPPLSCSAVIAPGSQRGAGNGGNGNDNGNGSSSRTASLPMTAAPTPPLAPAHPVFSVLPSPAEATHAASRSPPGVHQPGSPLTPCGASHVWGGSRRGDHLVGIEELAVYGRSILDRRISLASSATTGGRSSMQLAQPVSTALLERVRKTASFASVQSTSGRTDAPLHFEDLLDAATVSSICEDDELTRDVLESLGGGTVTSPGTALGTDEADTNDDTDAGYDYDFDEDAEGSLSVLSPQQMRRRRRGTRRVVGALAIPLPDGTGGAVAGGAVGGTAATAGVVGRTMVTAMSSYSGTTSMGASPPLLLDADPPLPLHSTSPQDTEDDQVSLMGSSHTRTPTTTRRSSVSPSSTQLQVGLLRVSDGDGEGGLADYSGSRGSFGTDSDNSNALSAFGRSTIAAPPLPPLHHLTFSRAILRAGMSMREGSSFGAKEAALGATAAPPSPASIPTSGTHESAAAAAAHSATQSPPPQPPPQPPPPPPPPPPPQQQQQLRRSMTAATANSAGASPLIVATEDSISALEMPQFMATSDSPFLAAGAATLTDVYRTPLGHGIAEDAVDLPTQTTLLEGNRTENPLGAAQPQPQPQQQQQQQQQQQRLRGVWARRVSRPPPLHLQQPSAGGTNTPLGFTITPATVPGTACPPTSEPTRGLDHLNGDDGSHFGLPCPGAALNSTAAADNASLLHSAQPLAPRNPALGTLVPQLAQRPPIAPFTPGNTALPPQHHHRHYTLNNNSSDASMYAPLATPPAPGFVRGPQLYTPQRTASVAATTLVPEPDSEDSQSSLSLPLRKSETTYLTTSPLAEATAATDAADAAAAAPSPLSPTQLPPSVQQQGAHAAESHSPAGVRDGKHVRHEATTTAAAQARRSSFYLLWMLLPYGAIVVLLALATFVATHVVSQGIVSNSLAERHSYVRSELVAIMEDVTLLPVMASETLTSSHIKDPARPREDDFPLPGPRQVTRSLCAAIKFTDLANSMVVMTYFALRSSEPLDEVLYVPLRRDNRVDTENIAAAATAAGRSIVMTYDDADVNESELFVDARSGVRGLMRKPRVFSMKKSKEDQCAPNGATAAGAAQDTAAVATEETEAEQQEPPRGREVRSPYAYCILGHTVAFFATGYLEAGYAGAATTTPTTTYVNAIDPLTLNMSAPLFSLAKVPTRWSGDDMAHFAHVLPIVNAWKSAVARGDGSEARVSRWWISSEPYEHPSVTYVHPFYEYGRSEPSLVSCRLEADALLRDFVENDATRGSPSERPRVMLLSPRKASAGGDAPMEVDIIARSWTVDLQEAARRRRFAKRYRSADEDSDPGDVPSPADGSEELEGELMRWRPWVYLGAAKTVPVLEDVGDELVQAALQVIDVHRYAADTHHRAQKLFGEDGGNHTTSADAAMAAAVWGDESGSLYISSTSPAARQYRLELGDSRRTFMPTVFRQFLFHGQKVAVSMSAVHLSSNFTAMVVVVTPPVVPASRLSRWRETALRYVAAWMVAGVAAAVTYLVYVALTRYLQLPLIAIEQHLERVVAPPPPRTPTRHTACPAKGGGNAAVTAGLEGQTAASATGSTAADGTLRSPQVSAPSLGRSGRRDSSHHRMAPTATTPAGKEGRKDARWWLGSGGVPVSTSSSSCSSLGGDTDVIGGSSTALMAELRGTSANPSLSSPSSWLVAEGEDERSGAGAAAEPLGPAQQQAHGGEVDGAAAHDADGGPARRASALHRRSGDAAGPSFLAIPTAGPSRIRTVLRNVWHHVMAKPRRCVRYMMRMRLAEVAELQDMCRELRHHVRELRQYIPESYDLDGSISGTLMDMTSSPTSNPTGDMPPASASTSPVRAGDAAVTGAAESTSFNRSDGSGEAVAMSRDLMALASQSVLSVASNTSASRWIRRIHRASGYMPGEGSPTNKTAATAAASPLGRSGSVSGWGSLVMSDTRNASHPGSPPPLPSLMVSDSRRLSGSMQSGSLGRGGGGGSASQRSARGTTPPHSPMVVLAAAPDPRGRVTVAEVLVSVTAVEASETGPLDVRSGSPVSEEHSFIRLLSRASSTLRSVAASAVATTATTTRTTENASDSASAIAAPALAGAAPHNEGTSNKSNDGREVVDKTAGTAGRAPSVDSAAAPSAPDVKETRVHHELCSSQSTTSALWSSSRTLLERCSRRIHSFGSAGPATDTSPAAALPSFSPSRKAPDSAAATSTAPLPPAAATRAAAAPAAPQLPQSSHQGRGAAAANAKPVEEPHREGRRPPARGLAPNRFAKCLCSILSVHVHVDRDLKVVQHFPEILEVVVDAVGKYGGHFDVFVPEMVYASFGSRVRVKDHAVLATRCAAEIFSRISAAALHYCTFVVDTGVYNIGICGVPQHQGFVMWGRPASELLWEQQLFCGFRVLLTDSVVPLIRHHFRVAPVDVMTIDTEQGKPSVVLYALLPGSVSVPWWPSYSRLLHQAFLYLLHGHYEQAAAVYDRLVEFPIITLFMVYASLYAHAVTLQANRNGLSKAELARQADEEIVRWIDLLCRDESRVLMPFGTALPWLLNFMKPERQRKHPGSISGSDTSLSIDSAPLGTAAGRASHRGARGDSGANGGREGPSDSLWYAAVSHDHLTDVATSPAFSHAESPAEMGDQPLPRMGNAGVAGAAAAAGAAGASTSSGTAVSEGDDDDDDDEASDDAGEGPEWFSGARAVVPKATYAGIALRVTDASGVSWQLSNEPIGGDLAPPYADSSRGFVAISSAGTMAEIQVYAVRENVDGYSVWSSSGVMSDLSHPRASLGSTSVTATASASTAARDGCPQELPLPALPTSASRGHPAGVPVPASSTTTTKITNVTTTPPATTATARTPPLVPRGGASSSASTSPTPSALRFQTTAMRHAAVLSPNASKTRATLVGISGPATVVSAAAPVVTSDEGNAWGTQTVTPLSSDTMMTHSSIVVPPDVTDRHHSKSASARASPVAAGLSGSNNSIVGDGGSNSSGGGGGGAAAHRSALASTTTGTATTHASHGIDFVIAAASSNVDIAAMQGVPRRFCHGNIVQLISIAATSTHVYTITEPLSGRTLRETVSRFGSRLALATTRKFCVSLLRALEYLHVSRSTVHGRMQPDNVICGVDGTCKLTGMLYLYDWARPDPLLYEQVKHRLAAYSAPEVNLGRAPTPASDIYSFGLLLLQLLTGQLPWSWKGTHEFSAVSENELSRVLQDNRLFMETLESGVLELRQYGHSRNLYRGSGSPDQAGLSRLPHSPSASNPLHPLASSGLPDRHDEMISPSTCRHLPPPLPSLADGLGEELEEDPAMLLVLESCLAPNPADRKSALRLLELLSEM